jgi:hypothetical protein
MACGDSRKRVAVTGDAGHRGAVGSAAASCAAAHRRDRPPPRYRDPEQARAGYPPPRPRELADARTPSGHEHQGDEASRQNRGEKVKKIWHLQGWGRSALP